MKTSLLLLAFFWATYGFSMPVEIRNSLSPSCHIEEPFPFPFCSTLGSNEVPVLDLPVTEDSFLRLTYVSESYIELTFFNTDQGLSYSGKAEKDDDGAFKGVLQTLGGARVDVFIAFIDQGSEIEYLIIFY